MTTPNLYQIALSLFPRIGSVNARRLVAYLGSVNTVFECNKKQLQEIPGIGEALIKIVINQRDVVLKMAEEELRFIEKYKLQTFFYLEKNFPRRLGQCDDAPVIMYMKGDINLNNSRVISIVGTRNATEYGREMTETLISDLASKGIDALIVSGLAYGIDVIAHKAAMKFNLPTLGVVGHGLDRMYPAAHASIAKEMVQKNGGLLSDFPSGSKIDPGNFLRRNRIVAGLADCTIVVESGKKGGALVTADIASSYNRDVMAFPGKTTDTYSSGCNDLIKQNKAALIENADDLITLMGWTAQAQPIQQALFIDLTTEEQLAMELLRSNNAITVDELARSMKKTVQQINTLLLSLEFNGLVKALPGNRFKIVQKNYQATPPISPF